MSKYSKAKKELKKIANKVGTNPVKISISDETSLFSPFAENNQTVISGEFANFLDNAVKDVPINEDLNLEITTNKYTEKSISKAIKNYYYSEFIETERKLKNNLLLTLITLFVGIGALAAALILTYNGTLVLLQGAIDIFAWVFLWETVDLFFFRRPELKFQQHRQINLINAKIIIK